MPTLRLPFLYHVEVTKPRHRKPETFTVSDHADFVIPHVSSADAPVSVTWAQHDAVAAYPDHYRGRPVPLVVARTWDGRTYLPMGDGPEPAAAPDFEAAMSPGARGGRRSRWWDAYAFRYPSQEGFGHDHAVDREKGCSVGGLDALVVRLGPGRPRIGKDDRDVSMNAALRDFPRRLLVVDGGVWTAEAATEPHYVVHDGANGIEVDVTMSPDPAHYSHVFRADRRDDAVAWAGQLAVARGRKPSGVKVTADTLDVVDPVTLCLDDGVFLARQMLSTFRTAFLPHALVTDHARAREVEAEVSALAGRGRGLPDGEALAWAAQAVDACSELRTLLEGAGLYRGDAARTLPALRRWEAVERDRRPDMVEAGRVVRGAPDAAMASFTP